MIAIPSVRPRRFDDFGGESPRAPGERPSGSGARVVVAALAVVIGALVTPFPAAASDGEASLRLAGEFVNASRASRAGPHLGAGLEGRAVFGLSDFWSLSLGAETAWHPPATPGDDELGSMVVQDLFGGVRYNLDVFTYVPYIGLSAVAYPLAPPTEPGAPQRANVGAKLTVGIDWRMSRSWSLGGLVELHSVGLEFGDFPSYASVGFSIGYHFRL